MKTTVLIKLEELLDFDFKLPAAPQLLPRLQSTLRREDCSPMDIVGIIKMDSILATKVLKTANSAFYSSGGAYTSLESAINRIGFNGIYQIVSAASVQEVFLGDLQNYRIGQDQLIEESVHMAMVMMELCLNVDDIVPENIYTLGLLHSIGKVIVDGYLVKYNLKPFTACLNQRVIDLDIEKEILGFHHGIVGSEFLKKWGFPEAIWQPLGCIGTTEIKGDYQETVCLLNLARELVDASAKENPCLQDCFYWNNAKLCAKVGLEASDFEEMLEVTQEYRDYVKELIGNMK